MVNVQLRYFVLASNNICALRQFLAAESPLKVMKNASYFMLKDLLVLRIFKILSQYFGQYLGLISKFMTLIIIQILPNISRSECNQAMLVW